MTQQEFIKTVVKALDEKKAQDIKVLGIKDLTILADYFIIAGTNNTTHVKTLADEVEFKLSELGVKPTRTEGYNGATWIILDYSDVIIHIFHRDTRDFYKLEKMWADAEESDISQYLE